MSLNSFPGQPKGSPNLSGADENLRQLTVLEEMKGRVDPKDVAQIEEQIAIVKKNLSQQIKAEHPGVDNVSYESVDRPDLPPSLH